MRTKFSDERKVRRHHRVVEVLRQELTQILQREVKDPRLGHFTITGVDLSPDLHSAMVYVCRFISPEGKEPTKEEQDALVAGLSSASHFIYERLKKRLSMKQIPSVRFEYDYKMSELSNIWNLVRKSNESPSSVSVDEVEDVDMKGAAHGGL